MPFAKLTWISISVGTVVLSAVMLGCTVIALHGATRVPDDLFIDDSQVSIFLSIR